MDISMMSAKRIYDDLKRDVENCHEWVTPVLMVQEFFRMKAEWAFSQYGIHEQTSTDVKLCDGAAYTINEIILLLLAQDFLHDHYIQVIGKEKILFPYMTAEKIWEIKNLSPLQVIMMWEHLASPEMTVDKIKSIKFMDPTVIHALGWEFFLHLDVTAEKIEAIGKFLTLYQVNAIWPLVLQLPTITAWKIEAIGQLTVEEIRAVWWDGFASELMTEQRIMRFKGKFLKAVVSTFNHKLKEGQPIFVEETPVKLQA